MSQPSEQQLIQALKSHGLSDQDIQSIKSGNHPLLRQQSQMNQAAQNTAMPPDTNTQQYPPRQAWGNTASMAPQLSPKQMTGSPSGQFSQQMNIPQQSQQPQESQVPQQPQSDGMDLQSILKRLQPTGGQSIANAMSVLGGGKPIYDPNLANEFLKTGGALKMQMAPYEMMLKQSQMNNQNAGAGLKNTQQQYVAPQAQANINAKNITAGIFPGQQGQAQTDSGLPPAFDAIAKQIANYTGNPSTLLSRVPPAIKGQIQQAVTQLNPQWSQQNYETVQKIKDQYASGDVGANIKSFNTAIPHLGELNQAIQNVPSSNFQPLESAQRWGAKTFNNAGPTNVAMTNESTALNAVTGELSNIFKRTGGTDTEIGHFLSAYDPNSSKKAKQAYIQTGIRLMKDRLDALGNDWTRTMGQAGIPNSKYPGQLVSPQAQQIIDQIGGKSGGGNKPGNPPPGATHYSPSTGKYYDANGNPL